MLSTSRPRSRKSAAEWTGISPIHVSTLHSLHQLRSADGDVLDFRTAVEERKLE